MTLSFKTASGHDLQPRDVSMLGKSLRPFLERRQWVLEELDYYSVAKLRDPQVREILLKGRVGFTVDGNQLSDLLENAVGLSDCSFVSNEHPRVALQHYADWRITSDSLEDLERVKTAVTANGLKTEPE